MNGYRYLLRAAAFFSSGVALVSLVLMPQGFGAAVVIFIIGTMVLTGLLVTKLLLLAVAQLQNPTVEGLGRLQVFSADAPNHPQAQVATDSGPATGGPRGRGRLAKSLVSLTSLLLGVVAGFVVCAGGLERARVLADEFATSGGFQPLWNSELLDSDLASINAQLADRQLTSVGIHESSLTVDAVSTTDSNGIDTYDVTGGKVELSNQSSRGSEGVFGLNQVSADAVRMAVATVNADDPDANITSVSFSDFWDERLTLRVSIEGTYRTSIRDFDAATGEEITD